MVTGGLNSVTTEILQDGKWTVLKNGRLPVAKTVTGLFGLNLATVKNSVFSFGKGKGRLQWAAV